MIPVMRMVSRRMSRGTSMEEKTDDLSTRVASTAGENRHGSTEEDIEAQLQNADAASESSTSPRRAWWHCFPDACIAIATPKDKSYAGPYTGEQRFRERKVLSDAETYHFERLQRKSYYQLLKWWSKRFRNNRHWFYSFPRFFPSTAEAGLEMRDGLVTLWTTYIVAATLLASVAIQPFLTSVPNLDGAAFQVYGLLWLLVLFNDFLAITVTTLFLGWLLANPGKLTYMWICNIGLWIAVPSTLVSLATLLTLIAVNYTSWVVYGSLVGIVSIVVQTFITWFAIFTSKCLARAADSIALLE